MDLPNEIVPSLELWRVRGEEDRNRKLSRRLNLFAKAACEELELAGAVLGKYDYSRGSPGGFCAERVAPLALLLVGGLARTSAHGQCQCDFTAGGGDEQKKKGESDDLGVGSTPPWQA
jgi:hypothetical protein